VSKSSNESGASDASIAARAPVASAAKDSAVFDAAATRATNAAIALVLSMLVADVDVPEDAAATDSGAAAGVAADAAALDDAAVADVGAELVAVGEADPAAGVAVEPGERTWV